MKWPIMSSLERLFSGSIYGPDVDYWSDRCIMENQPIGNPMFPEENETYQINCVIKVLGNLQNEYIL